MRWRPIPSLAWQLLTVLFLLFWMLEARGATAPTRGIASWYGEQHRGKLMANGQPFDPDKLTAASWFYPLGTKVEVKLEDGSRTAKTVVVTITDRGPARRLVKAGRIIDLSQATFRLLAHPDRGLVSVTITRVLTDQT